MSDAPRVTHAEATRNAWQLQGILAESTRSADSKASFALAIESAALATVVTLAGSDRRLGDGPGGPGRAVLWAGLLLLGLSIVLAVLAVLPRHGRNGHLPSPLPDDIVFYGHMRHLTPGELADGLRHDPLPALARQLVAMSHILWTKQRLVRLSLLVAMGSGALIVVGALPG